MKIIQITSAPREDDIPFIVGLGDDGLLYFWLEGTTRYYTTADEPAKRIAFGTHAGQWLPLYSSSVYPRFIKGLPEGATEVIV